MLQFLCMDSIALYRKYRPHTFDEVLGQDHIVSVLKRSVAGGDITHSYLFCGSRGTGKTSIARILAREIGCVNEDLYEIDAASNRGIDDVRELREGVKTLPFRSPYKVYIVDEVHMLTKEAFNALLKTLEEPPKHAIFILATTDRGKLPETIVSRCQTFTFKKPANIILQKVVADIAKKEGYEIDNASADLVALLGDGSFRDTLGVLQLVLSGTQGKKITREAVERLTRAPSHIVVREILEALAEKNLERGLKAVRTAAENNTDFKLFLKLILEKLRFALLLRYAPKIKETLADELSEDDLKFIEALAGKKDMINSNILIELLDAYSATERSHIQALPLELALIKLLGEKGEQKSG